MHDDADREREEGLFSERNMAFLNAAISIRGFVEGARSNRVENQIDSRGGLSTLGIKRDERTEILNPDGSGDYIANPNEGKWLTADDEVATWTMAEKVEHQGFFDKFAKNMLGWHAGVVDLEDGAYAGTNPIKEEERKRLTGTDSPIEGMLNNIRGLFKGEKNANEVLNNSPGIISQQEDADEEEVATAVNNSNLSLQEILNPLAVPTKLDILNDRLSQGESPYPNPLDRYEGESLYTVPTFEPTEIGFNTLPSQFDVTSPDYVPVEGTNPNYQHSQRIREGHILDLETAPDEYFTKNDMTRGDASESTHMMSHQPIYRNIHGNPDQYEDGDYRKYGFASEEEMEKFRSYTEKTNNERKSRAMYQDWSIITPEHDQWEPLSMEDFIESFSYHRGKALAGNEWGNPEYVSEIQGWAVHPSLFPEDPDAPSTHYDDWVDYTDDEQGALEYAKGRGEVYYYDTEDEALAHATGGWKDYESPYKETQIGFGQGRNPIDLLNMDLSGATQEIPAYEEPEVVEETDDNAVIITNEGDIVNPTRKTKEDIEAEYGINIVPTTNEEEEEVPADDSEERDELGAELMDKYGPDAFAIAQEYIDKNNGEGWAPDENIHEEVYRFLGGKHDLHPDAKGWATLTFSQEVKDNTKKIKEVKKNIVDDDVSSPTYSTVPEVQVVDNRPTVEDIMAEYENRDDRIAHWDLHRYMENYGRDRYDEYMENFYDPALDDEESWQFQWDKFQEEEGFTVNEDGTDIAVDGDGNYMWDGLNSQISIPDSNKKKGSQIYLERMKKRFKKKFNAWAEPQYKIRDRDNF
tara:strand:+ start:7109 stop:9526 length:2418 start_codon:yes stop_codon:yes gene_type:complete